MILAAPSLEISGMISFLPFQAWRYNLERVPLDQVIAPPYDVISTADQEKLYARSPYNFVRLILNREEASDNSSNNRYSRSRDTFESWKREGIFRRDSKPAYYLYEQNFSDKLTGRRATRTALLGRLRLEPFEKKRVLPHEATLAKPREDRRRLLEATRTNFSPCFGLYEDPRGEIVSILESRREGGPLAQAQDDQEVTHRLWRVDHSETVERLHEKLSDRVLYIADGHHRYQTALEYGQAQREALTGRADQPLASDYMLMALVRFEDPGLVIFPTHRILSRYPGFDREKCLKGLQPYFEIHPLPVEALIKKTHESSSAISFGLVLSPDEGYEMVLKDFAGARRRMPPGHSEIWYQVDLNLLSSFLLTELWGFPSSLRETHLRYTPCAREALRSLENPETAAVFLVNTPRKEILKRMCLAGELMPQKSTYFYPKLASGLVMYEHSEPVFHADSNS